MRISPERLTQIDNDAPTFGFTVPRVLLDRKMRRVNIEIQSQIAKQHQAAFAVFEEAVRFVVAFEAFQFDRKDRPKESAPFILMLARVRSDLVSIRHLLLAGQESPALALARVFFEDIELTMAIVADPKFALSFKDAESPDVFWSKNVGYGKIYPYVEKFLHLGKQGKKTSAAHVAHHKQLKSFLSQHVHPTFRTALFLALPRSLDQPGYFENRPMGWFGEDSGRLCLHIAGEVQAFGATCINAFIKPNPPVVLANYKVDKSLATFLRPAHNLQTLLSKYSGRIYSEYERKSAQ